MPLSPAAPTTAETTISTSGSETIAATPSSPINSRVSFGSNPRSTFAAHCPSHNATHRGRTARACSKSFSHDEWAHNPTISIRSGSAAATSRQLTPIDPVEPSTTTRRRAELERLEEVASAKRHQGQIHFEENDAVIVEAPRGKPQPAGLLARTRMFVTLFARHRGNNDQVDDIKVAARPHRGLEVRRRPAQSRHRSRSATAIGALSPFAPRPSGKQRFSAWKTQRAPRAPDCRAYHAGRPSTLSIYKLDIRDPHPTIDCARVRSARRRVT